VKFKTTWYKLVHKHQQLCGAELGVKYKTTWYKLVHKHQQLSGAELGGEL